MRALKKWNYEKHDYEPYTVPDDWKVAFYADNMDEIINCPHCGKEITFGESFTSLEIYTDKYKLGYGVCEKCYKKEKGRANGFERTISE